MRSLEELLFTNSQSPLQNDCIIFYLCDFKFDNCHATFVNSISLLQTINIFNLWTLSMEITSAATFRNPAIHLQYFHVTIDLKLANEKFGFFPSPGKHVYGWNLNGVAFIFMGEILLPVDGTFRKYWFRPTVYRLAKPQNQYKQDPHRRNHCILHNCHISSRYACHAVV